MMKECELIHPLLSLYLEEDLSARDRLRVARHLNDCSDARHELEDYRLQRRALLALPEPEPPHDLHERILSHVGGGSASTPFKSRDRFDNPWWSRPGAWGLAAACLGVALFVSLYSDWNGILGAARPKAMSQAPTEVDLSVDPGSQESTRNQTATSNAVEKKTVASARAVPAAPEVNAPAPPPAVRQARRGVSTARRAVIANRVNPNLQAVVLGGNNAQDSSAQTFAFAGKEESSVRPAEPTAADKSSATLEKALQEPELSARADRQVLPLSESRVIMSEEAFGPASGVPTADEAPRRWSGKDGPYGREHAEVVGDPISLMAYWQILSGDEPLPPVDFKKESMAVIFLGTRPTSGYTLQVDGVQEGDGAVTVLWREEPPSPGSAAGTESSRPWLMQVIPKTSKPVLFLKKP